MGIKEFIRRTAENERDNIRDIRIDAGKKRKELAFDPETEIAEEDRIKMIEVLEDDRKSDWRWFLTGAMSAKILFPERIEELKLDDPTYHWVIEKIGRIGGSDWLDFSWQKAKIKLLYPEREKVLRLDERGWQGIVNSLESFRGNDWYHFALQAVIIAILFPERIAELKLKIDPGTWQEMLEQLKSYRRNNNWNDFSRLAANMRILFPERVNELKLDNIVWREMKKMLKGVRGIEWLSFACRAWEMKILAAHKVEVTDEGLKITMRDPAEEYREEQEPRPTRLSFSTYQNPDDDKKSNSIR